MLYILGNKTDKETREVSKDEAEAFAESHGVQYFEVSAKENKGIDDIFNRALESVCQNLEQGKY
jgi:predicted GTPase